MSRPGRNVIVSGVGFSGFDLPTRTTGVEDLLVKAATESLAGSGLPPEHPHNQILR